MAVRNVGQELRWRMRTGRIASDPPECIPRRLGMARGIVGPSQARCGELVRERFITLARGPRRTLELPNFGAINATIGQSPPKWLIDRVVGLRSDIEFVRFERRVPRRVEHPVAEDVARRDGSIRLGLDRWHRSVLRPR